MRRIRFAFAALALLLLVPIGLLVERALDSAAREQEARHQTLAERVFDEMERLLGEVSTREAERPFGHYRFYQEPARFTRSPLSWPSAEPYVVGYFQVDPDGAFHSPLLPRQTEEARRRGDWRPTPDLAPLLARLEAVAIRGVAPTTERVTTASEPQTRLQEPGTTLKASRVDERTKPEGPRVAAVEDERVVSDSYQQIFRDLNRGAQRKVKSTSSPPARLRSSRAAAPRPLEAAEGRAVEAPAAQFERREALELAEAAPHAGRDLDAATLGFASDDVQPTRVAGEGVLADSAPRHTVEIGPIGGRLVDSRFLVLHRTAILSGDVYRQGVVLDVPALADWISETVLGGTPLRGEARLELISALGEPSEALFAGDEVYRHRFADPFDPLAVAMALPVLADEGFNYLYPISLLLVVAGVAGLLALYRTVSVSLAFAERRNNFVAAVSHELKTPLTSIRMYGEMLRDGMVASDEKRAEYFSTITAESERLTRLINNVLEFSRLEQDNREMSLVVGAIGPVVKEAARLLEPHARDLGFSIEVDVEDDLPVVRFDRDAVLQVVFNLVDNALKYARDAGDRSIALRCRRAESGVVVAVCDRGPGVADRHLSKIFEPFYRGEAELTRTAKGTGIGLALVKGLGERMGAAVRGRNPAEGGFEVSLTFRPA